MEHKPVGFKKLSYATQPTNLAVYLSYFSLLCVRTFLYSCCFIVPRGQFLPLGLFLTCTDAALTAAVFLWSTEGVAKKNSSKEIYL